MGGVSSVACLPEHRRKGYVGQLLRHALTVMRESGQPISSLYTPHPALYRRFGWMYASSAVHYSFNPKDLTLTNPMRPQGRAYRISEEQWPTLAEIYREHAARRNGWLDRSERWWKEALFRRVYDPKRRLRDIAVWDDGEGRPAGYLVYGVETTAGGADHGKIEAEELIALTPDAYLGLLRYLMSHDLASEIFLWGEFDSPLTLCVDEPWRVKREAHHGFMLRIVDLPAAFAARPPAAGAPEGAFTVDIADAAAPWNQGAWRIESAGGRLSAARADGAADVSTDAAAFAAMYNGFLRPSDAVASGLAEASDAAAVALADRILSADYPPYPSDLF
jgi:predicted acetyltransferase